jgi:hypothetical protein
MSGTKREDNEETAERCRRHYDDQRFFMPSESTLL